MPIHTIAEKLSNIDSKHLTTAVAVGIVAYGLKIYSGGRKSIWEREWGGKLIIIVAPPEPTTFALMDKLLRLPSPPQILYLPPLASPLPQSLLTVLHAMKLAASGNPLAQLNCEPLPPNPKAIRDFTRKWGSTPYGTTGEGGRRVDAIVLGGNWECSSPAYQPKSWRPSVDHKEEDATQWTPAQYHFHLVTSLLPHLLKAPAERNIRIISLVSPAWTAALPGVEKSMKGQQVTAEPGALPAAGKRGITTLLGQEHLSLILNTLASAAYSKREVVPDPNAKEFKKRDSSVQSNILALSVIMPWARDEVLRPIWASGGLMALLWLLLYPLILIITPSPAQSVQSILFALNAPTTYVNDATAQFTGNTDTNAGDNIGQDEVDGEARPKTNIKRDEPLPVSQRGIKQGSVVRDCQTIELPGVLHDAKLAQATYEKLEEEVTAGVVASEKLEKERAAAEKKKPANAGEKAKSAGVAVPKPSTEKATSGTDKAKSSTDKAKPSAEKPSTPSNQAASSSAGSKPSPKSAGERSVGTDDAGDKAEKETKEKADPEAARKRADEIAGQERTDPSDTLKTGEAFAPDAKQHARSKARTQELAEQLGVDDDKVKPGESFADAVKEGTAEDRATELAQQLGVDNTVKTSDSVVDDKVKPGESFADALKEGTSAEKHDSHVQKGESFAASVKETTVVETAPGVKEGESAATAVEETTSGATAGGAGALDSHVHKGESFADAIKESHIGSAQAAGGAQASNHQAKQPQSTQAYDSHVHKGESFADAIKESHIAGSPASHQQPQNTPAHDSHVHKGESFADAIKEGKQ